MFPTNTPTQISRMPGTIDLEISDPVLILNEIARRYETAERVLMEYVDNALDDAEVLYHENEGRYPYPINIELILDLSAQQLIIKDNCRGMPRPVLERVVRNIGESQKRGVTWVNGQFGFGVQAFRAMAQSIRFQTKHKDGSHYQLELDREQHRGIKEAKRLDTRFPSSSGTGSMITIGNFDPAWFNFSVDSIKTEIENHFERLIARPNLTITVAEAGQTPVRCLPFDYDQLDGQAIQKTLQLTHRDEIYPVEIYLKVATDPHPNRAASFFARGRRINNVPEIKSFMRKSSLKTGLWSHPHLLGYIEVGEIVRLAITRDDFDRTRGRQVLYDAVLALEPEVKKLINQANKASKKKTLVKLESAVSAAVANVIETDARPAETAAPVEPIAAASAESFAPGESPAAAPAEFVAPAEEAPAATFESTAAVPAEFVAPQPQPQPAGTAGQYAIHFAETLPAPAESGKRSCLVDNTIYINTGHPDFKARMTYTRQGQPSITDRLNAYLAGVISIYYSDRLAQPEAPSALLEAQLDFILKLEATLRQQRSALERELAGKPA